GLFLLENGRAKRIVETNGLWQIKALESNPKFAIGGTYSGLYLFQIKEDRSLEAIQKIEGFEESSRFFEEDHLGRIWVGQYYKGLYQLNLSAALVEVDVQKISDEYDLPIKEHILLSKIDNELYIASQAGVYKLDEATDKIIEASIFSEQLGKQPVYFLKQDRQKNIHVFAEQLVGFFKQISSKNYVYVPSSLYQLRYYLNNDLLNVAVNTNDGILFNANDGFIHYRPELENRTEVDLPLVINSVFSVTEDSTLYRRKIFDLQIDQTNALLLLPRTKILHFEVESYQFTKANNQEFRYKLKGLEDHFSEWTNSNIKEYSNLKAGDYEFVVQTRNHLGEVQEDLPFYLEVKPPLYRTLGAKILYALLA
ncbi:MAG: triple tyrosine motif-containing protein, partial [Bacteroidota bacterium]